MAMAEEKGLESVRDGYTEDGTVDLRGRQVLRSKTGTWKACSFILGYEVFEKLAYSGISGNLVQYLTTKLHEGTVKSANNVNNWTASVWLTPLVGAYIADAHLGRYLTFLIAAFIYLLGMCLLTLSVSLPALRPPTCGEGVGQEECKTASSLQVGIFFCALYIIAVGTGGIKPTISTLGADQFDDFEPKEKSQKLSFFNWWMFTVFLSTLFASTFLIYMQDNVGWPLGYGLPTIGLAFSIILFLLGTPFYRHRLPKDSPITRLLQVLLASLRKWKVKVPDDPRELHELSIQEYSSNKRHMIHNTSSLRFLDKAATKTRQTSPWMLCPVSQVEETKQMMKMIPIWTATLIPTIVISQGNTLFIRQGTKLDRSMGRHFEIPPASLAAFIQIFSLVTIIIYDRVIVPLTRRYTKNPRGITLLQRLGIGLVLQIIVMVTASLAERKRLSIAREKHLLGQSDKIPLSVFILVPQFSLMGVSDAFVEVGKMEFFYDQAPESMKSLGTAYQTSTVAIGHFLSSFILSTVADITQRNGYDKGWILDNLNRSHLDYYYAFLAILSFLNLVWLLVVSKFYVYNADLTQTKMRSSSEMECSSITPLESQHTNLHQ